MYMQFVPEPLPGGQVGAQLNLSPGFLVNKCLRCSQSPGSSNGPQELIGSKEVTFLKLGGSSSKKTHGSKHFGQQRDHGSQGIKRQDKQVIHLWAFNLAFKAATPGGSKVPTKLETSLVGKVSPRAVLSPQSFLLCTGELSNSIPFILLLFFLAATTAPGCTSSLCRAGSSTIPATPTMAARLPNLTPGLQQQRQQRQIQLHPPPALPSVKTRWR